MSNPDRRDYELAIEALRQAFCKLQRHSFWADSSGGVRRMPDRYGSWVQWDDVHALFGHEVVDGAIAALLAKTAITKASGPT